MLAWVTLLPIAALIGLSFSTSDQALWPHFAQFVIPEVLINTFWLLLGVLAGTLLMGISAAWLTTICQFPGRRFFQWALMLPLAVPAYVLGFVHISLWDFSGPVQTALRSLLGTDYWFPPIRSTGGLIMVLSFALYPYVYLLARNAFQTQGYRVLEIAQSLGYNPWQAFWKVILPFARPWIIGGSLLVLMETLADFGTVMIFNYETFTTAIYKAWFSFFSLSMAAKLACCLLLFVLSITLIERWVRGKRKYDQISYRQAGSNSIRLSRGQQFAALIWVSLILLMAFILPFSQLVIWSIDVIKNEWDAQYWIMIQHALYIAVIGGINIVILGVILAYLNKRYKDTFTHLMIKISTIGYAIPGTVLAVGVIIPLIFFDQTISALLETIGIETSYNLLQGTLTAMLFAYTARFAMVAFSPLDSAFERITTHQEEVAKSLGHQRLSIISRIYLPQLKAGLFSAFLLIFVDIIKEMPITLMTRPFNWSTLSVRIFEMTTEGQWQQAALPSVIIVLVGIIPVMLLTYQSRVRKK